MRCPQCSHNQKFSDGMTCGKCRYAFALNPKQHLRIGDAAFLSAIGNVSGAGARVYTTNMLYVVLSHQLARYNIAGGAFMVVITGVAAFFLRDVFASWGLVALIGSGAYLAWMAGRRRTSKRKDFEQTLRTWRSRGKELPGLIETTSLGEPPQAAEDDVFDYGVAGILIVDDEIMVDVLVGNGLHTDARVMIVALSGYPAHLQSRALDMIEQQPKLPVYLLHASGSDMPRQISTGKTCWPARARYVDLGWDRQSSGKLSCLQGLPHEQRELCADMVPPLVMQGALLAAFADQTPFALLAATRGQGGQSPFEFEIETDFG